MERINGNIYLTYEEIVPGIMPKGTYDSAVNRNSIRTLKRGGRGSKVFVEYNSLSEVYKKLVKATLGDPEIILATNPIIERIKHDHYAQDFYTGYDLPTGGKLPPDYIKRYTTAASWLNTIRDLTSDKKKLKDLLGMSMANFWVKIAELIEAHKIALPKNRIRLQEKIELYKSESYVSLIEAHKFGNNNRAIVKDEVSESVLLELIANPHKHDDTIILEKYNSWAKQNGLPEIKAAGTIANYRKKHEWSIKQQRDGNKDNYNTYGLIIKRQRPSAPLLLINSDDNDLDLFFIDTTRTDSGKYYHRFKLVVVIDAFNDYILGYAVGRTQTTELVQQAYLNAMYNIKRLTGSWYLPHQIQTDRWGLDKKLTNGLAQFYKSLGTFTPAAVHNARSKYIERSFGTSWHQQLKLYPNYAGHNITSKEKLNTDAVELYKKNFPTIEESPAIIDEFITRMRQHNGREEKWLTAFNESNKSQQRAISDEHMLLLFGTKHETGNQYSGNTITNKGVVVTIDRVEYTYEVPEELYLKNVGKQVQVIYDKEDLNRVLITDGNTLRFVAYQAGIMPSALADYKEGDKKRLDELLRRKQRDMLAIAEARTARQNILHDAGIDANSILQAGVLVKNIKQGAEQKFIEDTNSHKKKNEDGNNSAGSGFSIYNEF